MIPHTVVLMAALVALLCLPCALFRMIRSESAMRRAWVRRARLERPRLGHLERTLVVPSASPSLAARSDGPACGCGPVPSELGMPTFDQVLFELRRLDRQRLGGVTQQSDEWARAVVGSYDRWLQIACTYLSVSHHLSCLTDHLDREIERLRVEAELAAAGLPPIRRADV
jgi:hypothetical protein